MDSEIFNEAQCLLLCSIRNFAGLFFFNLIVNAFPDGLVLIID